MDIYGITIIFKRAAKSRLEYSRGKLYKYAYSTKDGELKKYGICTINDCTYSEAMDCDIISIQDICTYECMSAYEFDLELYEF